MYRMRRWSVRHARGMKRLYHWVESLLIRLHPIFERIGYKRLDPLVLRVEKFTKGFLLDSQSCGQCVVAATGMSCPMNCPKSLRNGPCGGVRADGKCEVEPGMDCVWVLAWEGNKQLGEAPYPIQHLQPPVDNRLRNSSAWLREVRIRVDQIGRLSRDDSGTQ